MIMCVILCVVLSVPELRICFLGGHKKNKKRCTLDIFYDIHNIGEKIHQVQGEKRLIKYTYRERACKVIVVRIHPDYLFPTEKKMYYFVLKEAIHINRKLNQQELIVVAWNFFIDALFSIFIVTSFDPGKTDSLLNYLTNTEPRTRLIIM